jgi:hypothetical protein
MSKAERRERKDENVRRREKERERTTNQKIIRKNINNRRQSTYTRKA